MIRLALALALLALPTSALAQAQTIVLLPQVNGDAHITPETRERAVAAITRALEAEGLTVRTEVPEALRECGRGPCIAQLLEATDSELAARVTIWAREGQSTEAGELVVGLVTPEEHSFEGSARVEGDAIDAAAIDAVHQANARFIVGPGPFLLVHGEPFGATVHVDGEMAGGLPWNGRVEPGQHEVRVEREGFVSQTHTVQVPDDITAREELEVELVRVGAATGSADPTPHIVGSALLGGVGIGFLVAGITTFAVGSCDAPLTDDRCGVGSPSDEGLGLAFVIIGGVAIAGAVTWLAIGLSSSEGDGGGQVEAGIGPGSLHLRGTF